MSAADNASDEAGLVDPLTDAWNVAPEGQYRIHFDAVFIETPDNASFGPRLPRRDEGSPSTIFGSSLPIGVTKRIVR